ncbi:MAG: corrinoid protein [Candidatus Omnitrophica bacterium]|nr:corrinoid protein [Candidatus Omnitrophota bacterium]MBU4487458.1 corrinoid protein [Candidatus Omnitrophota bacterium]MCG2705104.1 corrinoid protein [Candidatus Omnitrophota bacterium]
MHLDSIKEALRNGEVKKVAELTGAAISANIPIRDILDTLIKGMDEIGKRFKNNEIFIPEVLISAKAMHAGLNMLEPHFSKSGIKPVGKIGIGTVKGDLHDIGKNLVAMMFRGAGFEVLDLGIDVPAEKFIDTAKNKDVNIIAMSSLLTTSMGSMKAVISELKKEGLMGKVKTMVGGAPVTEDFAGSIGADGYAKDASSAVDKARELIGLRARDE